MKSYSRLLTRDIKMKKVSCVIVTMVLMIVLLLTESFTDIDIWVSDNFYDFNTHKWIIGIEEHNRLSPFFYEGAKRFVAFVGTLCVLYMLASIWIKKWRWNCTAVLTVLLCTIIIPTAVGKLKRVTNVYCPNQFDIYEAQYPYVKIFESYPPDFHPRHKGRCFPAGHVTGALSLMSLYLVFRDQRKKYLALGFAVCFSFVTGCYQMLRGEHFITDTLFSLLIAIALIIIINAGVTKIRDVLVSKRYFC